MDADGKLLARLAQHVDSGPKGLQRSPTTRVQTDVEIPSEGVHKSVVQTIPSDKQEKRKYTTLESSELTNSNVGSHVFHIYKLNKITLPLFDTNCSMQYLFPQVLLERTITLKFLP